MIREHCSAEDIARALKGRRSGRNWLARCPAHDDRTPSLSIAQGEDKVLVHCHAGCHQQAVINALKLGNLWSGQTIDAEPRQVAPAPPADDALARKRVALRLWSESVPIGGTLAEHYFIERRRLDVRSKDLGHALRWHAGKRAVVALMIDAVSGEAIGVHRTFLDANGGKIERRMLGRQGVVRLSPTSEITTGLGITEGIEDGLAVLLSGWSPIWAATSAGAVARFPVVTGIDALTLFADADAPGIQAAEACAARWRAAGCDVRISYPSEAAHG